MSKFEQFWDRIKSANKGLVKAEEAVTVTLPAAELRRLLEKAYDEGARSSPELPSLFKSIFGS